MRLSASVLSITSGVLLASLEWITLTSAGPETMTKCKGGSLMLNKPSLGEIAQHVFVYRNGESVAATSVPAAGHLQSRLLVHSDTSVTLTNLTSDDLGLYRVEIKLSEENTKEYSLRLVVGEPPETIDGNLFVLSDSSEASIVSLKCGAFTSLGYPPVSVIWKDPSGQLLASTGFSEQYFTLKLPVNIAKSGSYCCQLDCGGPNYCCLDDMSPLRQCVQVDVQTGKKDKQEARDAAPCELTSLEQGVLEVDVLVQELKSEKVDQDCGHSSVAAMAHLVNRQAKCDQLDSFIDRVDASDNEFRSITKTIQYMQVHLESMNQTMADLLDGLKTINDSLVDHQILSNQRTASLEMTLRTALSKHQLIESQVSRLNDWMSKESDFHSQVTENLTAISRQIADVSNETADEISAMRIRITDLENVVGSEGVENANSSNLRGECPTALGYAMYGSDCLKMYTISRSYTEAQARCEADGTHLYNMKCPETNRESVKMLMNKTSADGFRIGHAWTGARDLRSQRDFVWSDGTMVSPQLWFAGEPNNQGKEDCVELYTNFIALNDKECHFKRAFICQADSPGQ